MCIKNKVKEKEDKQGYAEVQGGSQHGQKKEHSS
jgi:hypothetical protein